MTIGQRIADKRKELGLSQEALGEQLGLSRQAVYKWEADSALPEIDKLIALSRLFGVSVGWLLGVEEEPVREQPEAYGDALTPEQLRMVEEISGRYIEAMPRPRPRRRWPWVAAAVVLCLGAWRMYSRLDQLTEQNSILQQDVGRIQSNVDRQIYGITERVESILKAQNDLTADYSVDLVDSDLQANTVAFSLSVVPKTYAEGTEVRFLADSDGETEEFPAERWASGAFTATAEVPLTDEITLSVVFLAPDGTRSTQLVGSYTGLYRGSLPEVGWNLEDSFMWMELGPSGTFILNGSSNERYLYYRGGRDEVERADGIDGITRAGVREMRVGLFKNRRLVAWAEPCERPHNYHGFEDCTFFRLPTLEVPLEEGDALQVAAVVKDTAGRITLQSSTWYTPDDGELVYGELFYGERDMGPTLPSDWDYPQDAAGWPVEK